jgi:hypothetical protein
MAVCDICGTPGVGTVISAENMRQAVFINGFNPLALGLVRDPMALTNRTEWYEGWKNTIVAQDTSDWNICSNCMAKLTSYLVDKPTPTGVTKSTVSADPLVSRMAGAAAEQKYIEGTAKPSRSKGYLFVVSGLILFALGLVLAAATIMAFLDTTLVDSEPGPVLAGGIICISPILVIGFVLLLVGISRLRR